MPLQGNALRIAPQPLVGSLVIVGVLGDLEVVLEGCQAPWSWVVGPWEEEEGVWEVAL